eukprot:TRINITY_DN26140_c0_g1_i1.p1 TRINITY_DN26140_c0_g1~~TRINITY_DN26140_c0_g1_i1.p1  ORF type:complete len:517 (-),score=55.72 TRINITY_DN26140_c0_g1_i1:216-1766(-)
MCQLSSEQKLMSHILGVLLLSAMCLLATLFPRIVGHTFITCTHSLVFFGILWHLWDMTASMEYLIFQRGLLVHIRLVMALVCGHFPTVVTLNSVVFGLQAYLLVSVAQFDPTQPTPAPAIREALVHAFLVIMLSFVFEATRIDQVKQLVLAQTSSKEAQTVVDVLNTMCDAVVELCDMTIKTACPRLEALTFRFNADGLRGKPFLHYVALADRDRCEAALGSGADTAFSLHLSLLDSSANKIPVQMFVKCLTAWNSALEHIIGIREDGDPGQIIQPEASASNAHAVDVIAASYSSHTPDAAHPTTAAMQRPASASSQSESGAGGWQSVAPAFSVNESRAGNVVHLALDRISQDMLELPADGWADVPMMWIEPVYPWSIRKMTRCFANTFGPSCMYDRTDVERWLRHDQLLRFQQWMEYIVSDPEKLRGLSLQDVILVPPHLAGKTKVKTHLFYNFRYTCQVSQLEAAAEAAPHTLLAVMLGNVRFSITPRRSVQALMTSSASAPDDNALSAQRIRL